MRLIDLYHKAFKAFRSHTQDESNSQKLRKIIANTNQIESLTSIKFDCQIDEDWIENIEEGLIYIEKAIREDRQFIRTEGEVVQIEKVKRVSKASVEHLSRHSDLITRAPEGDITNIIPDKLYVVEKLSDYLVYENRFLYMLLCYLKDFIQMRLDKIRDKTTTYQSEMSLNKDVVANQRHIQYELNYHDLYKNDPFLTDNYKQIKHVNRVENIYAMVVSFLNTPLMREVAKAPMIKPPVVKTNVLRMNQNFRAALKLYDFVTAYNKDGYMFTENKKVFKPLPEDTADEIAETIQLTSAIAYITGNDIKTQLAEQLALEEQAKLDAENKKAAEELKRIKKRIVEMNENPAEYILRLEKRNNQLEKESTKLIEEVERNKALTQTIETLEAIQSGLNETILKHNETIQTQRTQTDHLNQKYIDDMTLAEVIHQTELNQLNMDHRVFVESLLAQHLEAVQSLTASYENREKALIEKHASEIQALIDNHQFQIQSLKDEHETLTQALIDRYESEKQTLIDQHAFEKASMIESYEHEKSLLIQRYETEKAAMIERYENTIHIQTTTIQSLNGQIDDFKTEIKDMRHAHQQESEAYELKIDDLEKQIVRLEDEKKYVNAQYLAFKKQHGLLSPEDDFTSREKFKQLELEMIAYKKLFKEEWKKTKQKIKASVKKDTLMTPMDNPPDSNEQPLE